MDEDKKKLVDELLYDKECDVSQQLEWIKYQRAKQFADAFKQLVREHEEQKLEIITSWREAGEAVALAARLVNRAKATMDRQGWWFRFEEHKCDEGEDKVAQVKKGLNLAERGIDAMVEGLKAVEFPDTFVEVE